MVAFSAAPSLAVAVALAPATPLPDVLALPPLPAVALAWSVTELLAEPVMEIVALALPPEPPPMAPPPASRPSAYEIALMLAL